MHYKYGIFAPVSIVDPSSSVLHFVKLLLSLNCAQCYKVCYIVGNIVSQMSFHGETSGGIAKCWIPSQVTSTLLFGVLHLACSILKFLFSGFILEIIGLWDSVGADFKV